MASNSSWSTFTEAKLLKTESRDSWTDESSSSTSSGLQEEVISFLRSLVALQVRDPAGVHSRPSSRAFRSFLRNVQQDLTTLTKASEGLTAYERCSIRLFDSVLKLVDVEGFESKQGLQPHLITKPPVNKSREQWLAALPTSIKTEPPKKLGKQSVAIVPTVTIKKERPIQLSEHRSETLPTSIKKSLSAVGCVPCRKDSCETCQYHLQPTAFFTQYYPRKATHAIERRFDCESDCVVYLLECRRCPGVQYVGHTTRPLKEVIVEHRSRINSSNDKGKQEVHRHFNRGSHDVSDLQATVIDAGSTDRQYYWIKKLCTLNKDNPLGLNMRIPYGFSAEGKSKAKLYN